jgi:tRNA threonylcarbamoyl adenosine modification protein YeaZ
VTPFLAIDTSGGTSVAIVHNGIALAEQVIDDPMGHSENIGEALVEILHEAGLAPHEVSAVVVGRGPAPFTGLRVGIAAAIAFAEGIGKPLFGVVSHDAIARDFFDTISDADLAAIQAGARLLVTTDARRKEVYWSLYSGLDSHGAPVCVDGPHVNKPAELEDLLDQKNVQRITTDIALSPVTLARVAAANLAAGRSITDISALYLRAPDAVEPKAHGKFGKQVSS